MSLNHSPSVEEEKSLHLAIQLSLLEVEHYRESLKGKEKCDAPVTSERMALQTLMEELQGLNIDITDRKLARQIERMPVLDERLLEELRAVDAQETRDRELALRVSGGHPISPSPPSPPPPPSRPTATPRAFFTRPPLPTIPSPHRAGPSGLDEERKESCHDNPFGHSNSAKTIIAELSFPCIVCQDRIRGPSIKTPCGHFYDVECALSLFKASLKDETLFPPRCCKQQIALEQFAPHLSTTLINLFHEKTREFGTQDRVYCIQQGCSAFVGPATKSPRTLTCPKCSTTVCSSCKSQAHSSIIPCSTDAASQAVIQLAEEKGWKRCPGCHCLVELSLGCYHITCRCSKEFCYLCTEEWKHCNCEQWDEAHLVIAAEQRINNANRGRLVVNIDHQRRRIQEEVNRLRHNHDCTHPAWSRTSGGTCDTCFDFLPIFLLRCRDCHTLACRRCRYNRF